MSQPADGDGLVDRVLDVLAALAGPVVLLVVRSSRHRRGLLESLPSTSADR